MSRFLSLSLAGVLFLGANAFSKDIKKEIKDNSKGVKISKSNKAELHDIFQKAYGGSKKDIAYDVAPLDDGSFIIAGSTKSWGKGRENILITKFDKSGKPTLRGVFGGKQQDIAYAITKTSDGNFIAVGSSDSYSKEGDLDLIAIKFDKNLHKIWQKVYGGKRDDVGFALTPTPNGGALIVGYTESYGQGYKDGYVLFIDKNGKTVFQKAIGGKGDDILKGVVLSKKGGFFVAGKSDSYSDGDFDFYIAKFDSHGKFLFKKVLGGDEDDEFRAIDSTKDGGIVCSGSTQSFESKREDVDIMRFDYMGNMIWHKIYGFKSKEWANSIVSMDDGGFLVAGTTKSFGFGNYDFYILELDSKGKSRWANVYGGDNVDEANSVKRFKDGSYMVVGKTKSYGNGDFDTLNIKLKK